MIYLIGALVILTCYTVFLHNLIYKTKEEVFHVIAEILAQDTKELMQVSRETQEREKAFDERINKLKEEIALTNTRKEPITGSIADVLHPNVQNLPHDDVRNTNRPIHEIAE